MNIQTDTPFKYLAVEKNEQFQFAQPRDQAIYEEDRQPYELYGAIAIFIIVITIVIAIKWRKK